MDRSTTAVPPLSAAGPAPATDARAAARTRANPWAELAKPGLSGLVVATTAVGYLLGARGAFSPGVFLATVAGTGLLAAGASALNQWWEIPWDARMRRTRRRPLPSGRLPARAGLLYGLALGAGGFALLLLVAGGLTAGLGALTILTYVLVYTPLKRRTTLCTAVGAVVGAIPPVMGWTAATGSIDAGAWVLFAILFVWQIPHFLAIAWLYREDYARGGFRMLPIVDPQGTTTFAMIVLYSMALLPVSLAATLVGIGGWIYAPGALLLGGAMVALGLRLQRDRTAPAARRLFLATITYLPLLLLLLALDPTRLGG